MSWGIGLFVQSGCGFKMIRTLVWSSGSAWGKKVLWRGGSHRAAGTAGDGKLGKCSALGLPHLACILQCPLTELQQQKGQNCLLWNAESSFTLKEKKKYVRFIALPSVDPAIYLQILLPLKSLYTHIYRGSRFLGVLLMEGGFYTATVCFVLKTQPTAF